MPRALNIAALTRRTGVSPDTIRKWEQRYGVLHPDRTAGGQRRYSEGDVARVKWLTARISEGYRIGEAAALLGSAGIAAGTAEELRAELVAAAGRSDVPAVTSTVEQALLIEPVERAFAEVLAPALIDVGERWAAGELTVAQEHLASGAVRAALQRLLADVRGNVRGLAVLACAPGERHEIGLLMLAVLLRADGWQVAYLGADVPAADAAALARRVGAEALCFSVTMDETAAALSRELGEVHVLDSTTVLVGGRATERDDAAAAVTELRKHAA
jgi:MerR family transcriptional regulator, light-induced transcriptional regulator